MTPMHINRHSLKEFRIKAGLTQTELAGLSDISQGHIAQIEAGNKIASSKAIYQLAAALDISHLAIVHLTAAQAEPKKKVTNSNT